MINPQKLTNETETYQGEEPTMKIDPSLRRNLPQVQPAVPWASKDGTRKGGKVSIPGHRPLATPAFADGRLVLGGGSGSDDFYRFEAGSGGPPCLYAAAVRCRRGSVASKGR